MEAMRLEALMVQQNRFDDSRAMRYAGPNTEKYVWRAWIKGQTESGEVYHFYAGQLKQTVASAPGVAVVTHKGGGGFLTAENYTVKAGEEAPESGKIQLLVEPGDWLTVRARVDGERLTHVKLIKLERPQ